jgi:hypothetical protein
VRRFNGIIEQSIVSLSSPLGNDLPGPTFWTVEIATSPPATPARPMADTALSPTVTSSDNNHVVHALLCFTRLTAFHAVNF